MSDLEVEPLHKNHNLICVDPRVELLSILLKLSGYGNLYPGRISDTPSPYLTAIENHFSPYRAHEAVRYFEGINPHISGDLPVSIVLYLAASPGFALRAPFDGMIRARTKDDTALAKYVTALRQFAADTDFGAFFNHHKNYYDSLIASPEKSIQDGGYIGALENYFGWAQSRYFVILAPLLKSVAFGPRVYGANGVVETYCVFPSLDVDEAGRITFKEGKALENRILHEFGHSFVNPLVDQYWEQLAAFGHLMDAIQYRTNANYGLKWNISLYEHIVRAVTTRLTLAKYGEEAGLKELNAHIEQGFIYVGELYAKLETYENDRTRYPTFTDFFPEFMPLFAALGAQKRAAS